MERFGVFRAKDPQVSMWLQKNGFHQKRRCEGLVDTRAKTTQNSREEKQPAAQTKEVRFYADRQMHSKISTLDTVKQTAPEQERNKTEHHCNNRLSNLEMPAITSNIRAKRLVYQEREEPLQAAGNIYTDRKKIRSYSCPPDSRPTLSRRYSTMSLFSDRPCNIPVLIRNNDVRLRKYSCPEYFSTSTKYHKVEKGSRECNTKRLKKRTALNVTSNTPQQLANKLGNQTRQRQNETEINNISGENIKHIKNRTVPLKKELNDLSKDPPTDYNGNELHSNPASNSTLVDDGFDLVFCEESLESYSLEALPKQPTKRQNLPSSMYNSRGNMLAWLGEVNRNMYPQIRS